MKLQDIKVDGKYVIPQTSNYSPYKDVRARTLNGELGTVVTVKGVGPYTWVPGECGRREVIPSPERSESLVWVEYETQRQKVGTREEFETFTVENLLRARDLLLTEREWTAKNTAWRRELKRIGDAVKAHQAKKATVAEDLEPLMGRPGESRGTGWSVTSRWQGGSGHGYTHAIEINLDTFCTLLETLGRKRVAAALREYVELDQMKQDEITC